MGEEAWGRGVTRSNISCSNIRSARRGSSGRTSACTSLTIWAVSTRQQACRDKSDVVLGFLDPDTDFRAAGAADRARSRQRPVHLNSDVQRRLENLLGDAHRRFASGRTLPWRKLGRQRRDAVVLQLQVEPDIRVRSVVRQLTLERTTIELSSARGAVTAPVSRLGSAGADALRLSRQPSR